MPNKNRIKRGGLAAVGTACALLVFGACVSQVVFDENLPKEQSSRIFFYNSLQITAYNGIPVPKKSMSSPSMRMFLPPGEVEFELTATFRRGDTIYTASDVLFKYKFEAADYTITLFVEGIVWGVKIFNQKGPSPIGEPKEEYLVARVPFYKAGD
jgi:hypothetical protein